MIGALPKIWPWKMSTTIDNQTTFVNVNPLQFEGDAQLGMGIGLILLGAAVLILLERNAIKK